MARIMIENLFKKTLEAADHSKTLLQHFHDHGMDWMHACGGKGRCTTCRVIVRDGADHFQPMTVAEHTYRRMGALAADERLACQARIRGDVSLMVPEECKLPHVIYSDGNERDVRP
ncbi:MAG TPA: 2Fe-2S iron-sulfur cluster-binding protein [Chryseosolibacter sp.]